MKLKYSISLTEVKKNNRWLLVKSTDKNGQRAIWELKGLDMKRCHHLQFQMREEGTVYYSESTLTTVLSHISFYYFFSKNY